MVQINISKFDNLLFVLRIDRCPTQPDGLKCSRSAVVDPYLLIDAAQLKPHWSSQGAREFSGVVSTFFKQVGSLAAVSFGHPARKYRPYGREAGE